MSGIELQPEAGGDAVAIPTEKTTIGRGPFLKITDRRVSRNHANLELNATGQLIVTPLHTNPCFLREGGNPDKQTLPKDQAHVLKDGDVLGLLPDSLFYRVVYTSKMSLNSSSIHIRDVEEDLNICEENIRGKCSRGDSCSYHHYSMPYLWQVQLDTGWQHLFDVSENIEKAFCQLRPNVKFEMPATAADGTTFSASIEVNFEIMKAQVKAYMLPPSGVMVAVRRLSTPSYATYQEGSGTVYTTQWLWHFWDSHHCRQFSEDIGSPAQYVIEKKYLADQEVFRFEEKQKESTRRPLIHCLNFEQMKGICLNNNNSWKVARRPQFYSRQDVQNGMRYPSPPVRVSPIAASAPDTWSPVDPQQQYELVPLNPASMSYHLVASEFHSTLSRGRRKVLDVFRVQNIYHWNQFMLKKTMMESHGSGKSNERQLFHGTQDDNVVEAICRENFDWRVCGKNNVMFGKGSYFAQDASYSDKYTSARKGTGHHWMFLARVLLGKYAKGNSSMVRPPPLDAAYPHGALYDSCVNDVSNPSIFVIFDKDQCYPEYLISYALASS